MITRRRLLIGSAGLGAAAAANLAAPGWLWAGEKTSHKVWAPAVEPKALSETVKKGLHWIEEHQLENGGWGQGEESQQMGRGEVFASKSNVADTCMATLALVRAGSSPQQGAHSKRIARAIDYVLSQIEASDTDSLYVTDVRGTRVQSKIGAYIDTFLSSQLLAELKGQGATEAQTKRMAKGLDKVLAKIERNQRGDGTWDDRGWAPVLSQAVAAKGLARAKQNGANVKSNVLAKTEQNASQGYGGGGKFSSRGSAGVELYGAAASTGALSDSANSNEMDVAGIRDRAKNAKDARVREQAQTDLKRIEATKKQRDSATDALVARLEDPQFASGFGSNGGEEFLSYMLVSESLVVKGGDKWKKWDSLMAANLGRIQNGDGSWTGHHCITGRTFCTSAALLVLMADRAPVPLAAKVRG